MISWFKSSKNRRFSFCQRRGFTWLVSQKAEVCLLNLPRGSKPQFRHGTFFAEMSYRWPSLGCPNCLKIKWIAHLMRKSVKMRNPLYFQTSTSSCGRKKNKNEILFYLFICCLYLHGLKRCLLFFWVLLQLASEWLFDSFLTLVADPDVWLVWLI